LRGLQSFVWRLCIRSPANRIGSMAITLVLVPLLRSALLLYYFPAHLRRAISQCRYGCEHAARDILGHRPGHSVLAVVGRHSGHARVAHKLSFSSKFIFWPRRIPVWRWRLEENHGECRRLAAVPILRYAMAGICNLPALMTISKDRAHRCMAPLRKFGTTYKSIISLRRS